jgi:hypothetical protein
MWRNSKSEIGFPSRLKMDVPNRETASRSEVEANPNAQIRKRITRCAHVKALRRSGGEAGTPIANKPMAKEWEEIQI